MATALYLEDLRPFRTLGLHELVVGEKLLFVHLPDTKPAGLAKEADGLPEHYELVGAANVTEVVYMGEVEGSTSHGGINIRYTEESTGGILRETSAADRGLVPYNRTLNLMNSVNFTVRVAVLEENGIIMIPRVHPDREALIARINRDLSARNVELAAARHRITPVQRGRVTAPPFQASEQAERITNAFSAAAEPLRPITSQTLVSLLEETQARKEAEAALKNTQPNTSAKPFAAGRESKSITTRN